MRFKVFTMVVFKIASYSLLVILLSLEYSGSKKLNDLSKTIIDIYTLNSDTNLNPRCKKQALSYNEAFYTGEPWSLQMFDASSKFQSGILAGNLVDLGNFDGCLAINKESNDKLIQGKFCRLSIVPSNVTIGRIESSLKLPVDRIINMSVQNFYGLTWSVCIPDSCLAEDVQNHFQHVIPQLLNLPDLKIYADEDHCQTNDSYDQQPFRQSDWMALYVFGAFISLTFLSTIYDCVCRIFQIENPKHIFRSFSMYQNTISLLDVKSDGSNMGVLHGLRFLVCAWVITFHRFLLRMFTPNINTVDIQDWMRNPVNMLIMGSSVTVDTFWTISGMLALLTFFRTLDRDKNVNYLRFYSHRFLRLSPILAVVILFSATLLRYTGSGPYWFQMVNGGLESACRNNWISSLLYLQNYFNPEEYCIVPSWSLSVDMQLYLISPLVLYPLYYKPKVGLSILSVLVILPMFISFHYAWINHYDGSFPFQKDLLITKYFSQHYSSTPIRASPWFLGVALGYFVYKTKNQKVIIPKIIVAFWWFLTCLTMFGVLLRIYSFQQFDSPRIRLHSSLYLAISRTAWSLAISWIIFASIHGYGGILNRFLSWSGFAVMAKLTYGMYLVHFQVQFTMLAALKQSQYFSPYNDAESAVFDIVMAVALSFVLTVGIEMPIHKLEDYFLRQSPKLKTK